MRSMFDGVDDARRHDGMRNRRRRSCAQIGEDRQTHLRMKEIIATFMAVSMENKGECIYI